MRYRSAWLVAAGLSIAILPGCGHAGDHGHGAGNVADSPEARKAIAAELARMADRAGGYELMLDDGANLAQAATADLATIGLGRELSEGEAAAVKESLRGVLAEFVPEAAWVETVAQAFESHFTAAELGAIRDFYSSPPGQRLLELEPVVMSNIEAAIDARLEARIDEFIARADVEVDKVLPGLPSGTP